MMNYPLEGSYPQNEKEIAISADAKELFKVQIGDDITLNTLAGDFTYTISGFYEDDEEFNDIIDGTCMYMCKAAFDEVRNLNGIEPTSQFYIRFQSENGLKKTIASIKDSCCMVDTKGSFHFEKPCICRMDDFFVCFCVAGYCCYGRNFCCLFSRGLCCNKHGNA